MSWARPQVQSSIADVETNRLLQRYDEEVYSKIKSNFNAEFKAKKDEIEQTRIRVKELGNERRWLDWVEKYANRVGSLEDFSNEDKKEYLEGILGRIDVSLDKETNDHHLDLTFNLGLVDNGVEYSNPRDNSAGYKVVEGSTNASTVISYKETQNRHKDARRTGRQQQSAIDLKKHCDEGFTTYHRSPSSRDS